MLGVGSMPGEGLRISDAQLDEAVAFIQEHAPRRRVYVHCKAGYSRTAAVVGAALLAQRPAPSVEEVLAALRDREL